MQYRSGLALLLAAACAPELPTPIAAPVTACQDEPAAVPRLLFQVPRDGDRSEDFYRLPFPNDIRKRDGRVSLAGHPRPGGSQLVDPVAAIADAIEADSAGFGVNSAVYARF